MLEWDVQKTPNKNYSKKYLEDLGLGKQYFKIWPLKIEKWGKVWIDKEKIKRRQIG